MGIKLVLVLVLLLLSGYVYTENPEIISEIRNIRNYTPTQTSGCEELAKELFINLTLFTGMSESAGSECWTLETRSWKDGIGIGSIFNIFRPGSNKGENINLYYPSSLPCGLGIVAFEPLSYSKKIISPDGTILGTRGFSIKPILKPIPETEYLKYAFGEPYRKYMAFEIVEPNFVGCYWMTDDGRIIE